MSHINKHYFDRQGGRERSRILTRSYLPTKVEKGPFFLSYFLDDNFYRRRGSVFVLTHTLPLSISNSIYVVISMSISITDLSSYRRSHSGSRVFGVRH